VVIRKIEMGIKVIKGKKASDYTFIDDNLNLQKSTDESESDVKKLKTELDFRLRDDTKIHKLKKSKISGGHTLQGHSPIYE
jgi:hypothetical protein